MFLSQKKRVMQMKKFYEMLELRNALELTQAEFMRYMGFTQQSAYSRLENGVHQPTHQQRVHLVSLKILIEHDLLKKLDARICL